MKRKSIVAVLSLILVGAMAIAMLGFGVPYQVFGNEPSGVEQSMPGPEIPQLTESDVVRAKEIALADARVQELIQGRGWAFGNIGVWHSSWEEGLKKIGAALEINLEEPCQIAYDWPVMKPNEDKDNWPPYQEITVYRALEIKSLIISVDLIDGKVVQILPMPAG